MEPDAAFSDRYRLGSKELCMAGSAEGVELLPVILRDLLKRSESLYRRIARLDEVLFDKRADQAPGARAHLSRLEQAFGGE
jgi:regulator of CtrA degradation